MIEIKFELDPLIIREFDQYSDRTAEELDLAIFRIANILRNYIVDHIHTGTRTGRIYRKYKPWYRVHQASAKGEYPKSDTGRLVASIAPPDREWLKATIGSNLNYAEYLETKSEDHGGRPFLSRALNENQDMIDRELLSALSRIFR
jgi:phage gpG-like protein